MTCPHYLDVRFGDNDFGFPMIAALRRLWGWINKNNGHLTGVINRSVPQMFYELHQAGALESMIKRLLVLETLCGEVEFATRGLYVEKVDWATKKMDKRIRSERHENYLSCEVEFHKNKRFAAHWENGEHAWLNLVTGEVQTY